MSIKILIILIIIVLVIISICTYFGIGIYFFNFSLNPKISKKKVFKSNKKKKKKTDYDLTLANNKSREWFKNLNYNEIYINSKDNLKLHAYKINNKNSDKWVIIIHGYTSEALELLTSAKHFYDKGYNILMPDLRAHGKSEGKYSGMGWLDRFDILNWIDLVVKENSNAKIVLYGISMGAATVMMASGEKLPSNVKVAIEDCGYASVYEEFAYQLRVVMKLIPGPIIYAANIISKLKKHFRLYDASSINQIKNSKIPMLFIHGNKDRFVPFDMLDEVYRIYPCPKEKLVIDGAKHTKASIINPVLYWSTVDNFIKKYMKTYEVKDESNRNKKLN